MKSKKPSDDVLERLYLDESLSQYRIAENYRVTQSAVSGWLRKAGLTTKKDERPNKDELERLYVQEDWSSIKIAKKFGVAPNTVRRWLKSEGIKIRKGSEAHLPKGFKMPSREDFERLYVQENLSTGELAQKYGVSQSTVNNWLRVEGIEIKDGLVAHLSKGARRPSKGELEVDYVENKLTTVQIAKKYGVCKATASRWLRTDKIITRNRSEARLLVNGVTRPSLEELQRDYVDEKQSTVQLSEKYGASTSTFRRWLKEAGIKLRNASEAQLSDGAKRPLKDELESLYVHEELSPRQIANIYGVNPATIRNWLIRDGIRRDNDDNGEQLEFLLDTYTGGQDDK